MWPRLLLKLHLLVGPRLLLKLHLLVWPRLLLKLHLLVGPHLLLKLHRAQIILKTDNKQWTLWSFVHYFILQLNTRHWYRHRVSDLNVGPTSGCQCFPSMAQSYRKVVSWLTGHSNTTQHKHTRTRYIHTREKSAGSAFCVLNNNDECRAASQKDLQLRLGCGLFCGLGYVYWKVQLTMALKTRRLVFTCESIRWSVNHTHKFFWRQRIRHEVTEESVRYWSRCFSANETLSTSPLISSAFRTQTIIRQFHHPPREKAYLQVAVVWAL